MTCTEEKAYFLGLLYADGYTCIRKQYENRATTSYLTGINLKENDKYILETLSILLFNKIKLSKIIYKDGRGGNAYSLNIYNKKICTDLINLGCVPRKSLILKFPTSDQVPDHLINHFVRGYFDGDGSFSFNSKTCRPHTSLVCASENFRNELMSLLQKNDINIKYFSDISLHIQDKLGNLKFYDYIYENSTICLKRKKQKYEEFREYYQYNN
jgi:hypothetical protein